MSITFTQSIDDLIAFNLYHIKHSPAARRTFWRQLIPFPLIWTVVCLVLSVLAITPQRSWLQSVRAFLPFFLGAPVYLILFPVLRALSIPRQVRAFVEEGNNNTSLVGPRRIEITANGICETSESQRVECQWISITQVVLTDHHILLYRNPLSAFIVPKRSFADQSELTAFLDEVNRYSRTGGASCSSRYKA